VSVGAISDGLWPLSWPFVSFHAGAVHRRSVRLLSFRCPPVSLFRDGIRTVPGPNATRRRPRRRARRLPGDQQRGIAACRVELPVGRLAARSFGGSALARCVASHRRPPRHPIVVGQRPVGAWNPTGRRPRGHRRNGLRLSPSSGRDAFLRCAMRALARLVPALDLGRLWSPGPLSGHLTCVPLTRRVSVTGSPTGPGHAPKAMIRSRCRCRRSGRRRAPCRSGR
jgi:hypothetical protein